MSHVVDLDVDHDALRAGRPRWHVSCVCGWSEHHETSPEGFTAGRIHHQNTRPASGGEALAGRDNASDEGTT